MNMKNDDVYCFKWANTRALNPVNVHPERVTKEFKEQAERLNWDGMEFPTPCSERMFKKFEKNNKVNVSVSGYVPSSNGLGYTIIPLYVSQCKYDSINHLFFQKGGSKSHYGVVNNMSRLVRSQGRIQDFSYVSQNSDDRWWWRHR